MGFARDEAAVRRTFLDYVQAFQTLDPSAASRYCHVPCMVISSQTVGVMVTAVEVQALFVRTMDALKARGYGRSELTSVQVKQVSTNLALVSVSRVRYKTDGNELERLGETYTFRKTDESWKMLVAAIHDPDALALSGID